MLVALLLALGLSGCPKHSAVPHRAPPRERADPRTTMRVHFIDVGQGDAILFEFPCAAMLVDLGAEKNKVYDGVENLAEYLAGFFARRPDLVNTFELVAVTHPHFDHVQGTGLLVGDRSPYRVVHMITDGLESSSGGAEQKRLHEWAEVRGVHLQKIRLEDLPPERGLSGAVIDPIRCEAVDPKIQVLFSSPGRQPEDWEKFEYENINNHSLVLRVDFGATSVLLMGDLEERGVHSLRARLEGSRLLDADVLKVGHHGSWNATSPELLEAVSPDVAVIMMGKPEREIEWSAWAYGHPRRNAVERLLSVVHVRRKPVVHVPVATKAKQFEPMWIERAVYGTGWDGTVVIEATTTGKPHRVN
ncbi:MAG TPA: MBL fold metallo-hydrolase [Myxococcota bacterium]|nr:MBL fold metallo-hydrolase [Myxococcota bacterium]